MTQRTWRSLLAAASLFVAGSAMAVPGHITYTGELMADNGLPYTGNVDVTARLFTAASGGGAAVWEQELGTIAVMGGVLQADLMDAALMGTLTSSDTLWIEFEIDGETLSPRQKLASVPYAMVAGNAAMLGGLPAANFITTDGIEDVLSAENLPTDGINQVSNGSLKNQFMDVLASWEDGPVPIPDFHPPTPGVNALASVTTQESAGSYITGITIYTGFTLTALSDISLRLYPPPGADIESIVLQEGQLSPGGSPYTTSWDVTNTPELAGLLGKQIAGEWTLTITDNDDTLTAGTPVGQLTTFDVTYDVVRANHMIVQGRLDVTGELHAGDLRPEKTTYPDGTVRYRAPRMVKSDSAAAGGTCPGAGGVQRAVSFTLEHEAMVFLTGSAIFNSTSSADVYLRVDGSNVENLYYHGGTNWQAITINWAGMVGPGSHTVDLYSPTVGTCATDPRGNITAIIFE